jgi:Protein of unknown function (DUF3300)
MNKSRFGATEIALRGNMKSQFCPRLSRPAPPAGLLVDSAATSQNAASFHGQLSLPHLLAIALVLVLSPVTQHTLAAQQPWAQNPQYASSQYVQPNPNYVQYPQSKPSPYQYQQQPDPQQQPYGQQQYAQPQLNVQPYAQQPYADPAQSDPQQAFAPPQQGGQPFAADQLDQLVAPIALYPDALVAQILAASTYPAQVIAADNWLRSMGYASPDQIAAGANAQANWDPSIKALTAFPQVLAMMNRDLQWTTDLGNAYYNQPQDVLQTIQVMRQRAENAGTLRSTPQESVTDNQGYIQLAPPNPQVVYVPSYNPWTAYGAPVSPYPGFSLADALGAVGSVIGDGLRFGAGIGMAAFMHTPFGWAGWLLNWLTSSIFFNHSPYVSHSTSVAHWGGGRGGYYGSHGGINRTPNGFPRPQQSLNRPETFNRSENGYARGNANDQRGFTRPPVRAPENYAYNHAAENQNRAYVGTYGRPAPQSYAYNRPQTVMPARPQTYASPQQYPRAPMSTYQRNEFAQHSYAEPRSYGGSRSFAENAPRQEHSGGSHMFGGGHGSFHAPKAPKAPKMSGGGHHGGGGHGGGHHGR